MPPRRPSPKEDWRALVRHSGAHSCGTSRRCRSAENRRPFNEDCRQEIFDPNVTIAHATCELPSKRQEPLPVSWVPPDVFHKKRLCVTVSIAVQKGTHGCDRSHRLLFHQPMPRTWNDQLMNIGRGRAHHDRHGSSERLLTAYRQHGYGQFDLSDESLVVDGVLVEAANWLKPACIAPGCAYNLA